MSQLKELDPYNINVSEQNERTQNLNLSDLEESIRETGVIQPVIVRNRGTGKEVEYEVVIGQRRTMASQSVGVDSIPAIEVDWDDAEALEKSITENVDAFREEVSKQDRAQAIQRLKEMKGWTNTDVSESLGVSSSAIRQWLEPVRDEWEGTSLHPETDGNETGLKSEKDTDPKVMKQAREMTGGGEEGEQVVQEAEELGLAQEDMREAKKLTETDNQKPLDAVHEVAEDKAKKQLGEVKVRSSVTFTGNRAEAVQNLAEERGTTENKIVEKAVESYLNREGYL